MSYKSIRVICETCGYGYLESDAKKFLYPCKCGEDVCRNCYTLKEFSTSKYLCKACTNKLSDERRNKYV